MPISSSTGLCVRPSMPLLPFLELAPPPADAAPPTPVVNGRGIKRQHLSRLQRAARAAQQRLGEIIVSPSRVQAAEDWGVSLTESTTVNQLLLRIKELARLNQTEG
jgi:hypothetical protein